MEVVKTTTTTDPVSMYNRLNTFILNPTVFVILLVILAVYFYFSGGSLGSSSSSFGSFSVPGSSSSAVGTGMNILGILVVVVLIVLIAINAFQYFFSINLTAYFKGVDNTVSVAVDQTTAAVDSVGVVETSSSSVPTIGFKKQVFNIPGNYYNYDNAKALCKAYGAELATYDQIEKAYGHGAEWCNYGWSANQMALFPTQKRTYDTLQQIEGHENDCGRPGINGGYIANPNVQFGVNCYGNKPKMTAEEDELMKTMSPYPQTEKDLAFQKRVDFWKGKIDQILVSPFNYNTWGGF